MSQFPPPMPAQQAAQQGPPAKSSNGLAVTGFVLGLLGLLLCWIPVLNFFGILLGILGAVFGTIGLVSSKKTGTGKGLAIAGLVMGVLAVVLAILINVAFVKSVDSAIDDSHDDSDVSKSTVAASPDSDGSEAAVEETESAESTFEDGVLTTPDMKIVITDHKVIEAGEGGNYSDKPVIVFRYEITNISGADLTPNEWIWDVDAFQDNDPNAENELDLGFYTDDSDDLGDSMENIKKGGTVTYQVSYELDDLTTPVELVANDSLGFGDDLGRVTYELKQPADG